MNNESKKSVSGIDKETFFAGLGDNTVFSLDREKRPPWLKALRAAYKQFALDPERKGLYADPDGRGATLAQAWRGTTIFGRDTFCVLARPMPASQVEGISNLERCSPEELVSSLKSIFSGYRGMGLTTSVIIDEDNHSGHCINLQEYDLERGRFIYFDPSPGRSLLCKENNAVGVDAQQEPGRNGPRWSVTSAELSEVIFASFIYPIPWARLKGTYVDLNYDEWVKSEFYSFFHLALKEEERADDGLTIRGFTAGPVKKEDVFLAVRSGSGGTIVESNLSISRDWIAEDANIFMALDIAKSFIMSFAPRNELSVYEELSQSICALGDRDSVKLLEKNETRWADILRVVVGIGESDTQMTDFGVVSVENYEKDGEVHCVFNCALD
jgi:hypothetical protein